MMLSKKCLAITPIIVLLSIGSGYLSAETTTPNSKPSELEQPALKHDPFSRPQAYRVSSSSNLQDTSLSDLVLRGVLISGTQHTANINGQFVNQGETAFGYKIIEITPTSVTLIKKNIKYSLNLKNEDF
jgi:hypothetical protein